MSAARLILEALPVLLAFVAIFACGHRVITIPPRRTNDRLVFVGMLICAALLIVAQSSWTYTLLQGNLLGTDTANVVWTVFNTTTMGVFVLAARRLK